MPTVRFTDNIQRHVSCPTRQVDGATVRDALDRSFAANERARGYALDDQGHLRQHMAIFVDGRQLQDRHRMSDPVSATTIIDVVQALSGG